MAMIPSPGNFKVTTALHSETILHGDAAKGETGSLQENGG